MLRANNVRPYGYACADGLHGAPGSAHPTVKPYIKYNPQVPSIAIELYHKFVSHTKNLTCYIVGRDDLIPPYVNDSKPLKNGGVRSPRPTYSFQVGS